MPHRFSFLKALASMRRDLVLSGSSRPLGVIEPVIYAGASAIAIAVALLAGLPAARRATSVQPMAAIRSE